MKTKTILAFLLLAGLSSTASAIDATVHHIVAEEAESAELDETIIPRGVLIFRSDNPLDLRLGDGIRYGGLQLYNFAALTNPPSSYNTNLSMNGNTIFMGNHYSLVEEGNGLFVREGTNAVLRIFYEEGGVFAPFQSYIATPTQIVVTVNNEIGDAAPILEYTASIVEPDWNVIEYASERISEDTLRISIDTSDIDSAYIRITVEMPTYGAEFDLPVIAPSFTLSSANGDCTFTTNLFAQWSAAYGWSQTNYVPMSATNGWEVGSHAGFLTAETDGVFTASAAYGITTNMISAWNALVTFPGFSDLETDYGILLDFLPLSGGEITGDLGISSNAIVGGDLEVLGGPGTTGTNLAVLALGRTDTNNFCAGAIDFAEIEGTRRRLFYYDGDMTFGGGALWSFLNGTNTWTGRINGYFPSSGGTSTNPTLTGIVTVSANTTNYFIRPDGQTNVVVFGTNSDMQIYSGTNLVLTVRPDGNIGVRSAGSATYNFYATGAGYFTGNLRASSFTDTGGGTIDPSGTTTISNLTASGISQIILPTSTNGLAAGTLWNNAGTPAIYTP